jgi:hypothetical protein
MMQVRAWREWNSTPPEILSARLSDAYFKNAVNVTITTTITSTISRP